MVKKYSHSGYLLLPRRAFLRTAAGLSLAMLLRGQALAQTSGRKRLLMWYTPEGTVPDFFWPRNYGPISINMNSQLQDREAPDITRHENWILQPLKNYESRMILLRNIYNPGSGDHAVACDSMMSANGQDSIDVVVGKAIGGDTPFESLQMGNMGWVQRNPGHYRLFKRNGQRREANWSPAAVFNQIFPGGLPDSPDSPAPDNSELRFQLRSRLALLGSVGEELRDVACVGGQDARRRMEAYLETIESIEAQQEALLAELDIPQADPSQVAVDIPSGATNQNFYRQTQNFAEVGKLMMEVAVAGFALNRTRAIGLQWSGSGYETHNMYDRLNLAQETEWAGDHPLSHYSDGDAISGDNTIPKDRVKRDRARIYRWYATQLQFLLDRLNAIPEGDGSVLDNTIIATVTEFSASRDIQHNLDDLPLMIIAPPGSGLTGGQYVNPGRRSAGDYLLTLAQAAGASVSSVGEGRNVISQIYQG